MLRYLTKLVTSFKQQIIPMFCRVPISTRVADDLYQARVDLLNAQHNAEHWDYTVRMLTTRVDRLTELTMLNPEPLDIKINTQAMFDFKTQSL